MEDGSGICINNDYVVNEMNLFRILEKNNDPNWLELINKLNLNPLFANNFLSTSEHDLQFLWDPNESEDNKLIVITKKEDLLRSAIANVRNKAATEWLNSTIDGANLSPVEIDFNFIGPWKSIPDFDRVFKLLGQDPTEENTRYINRVVTALVDQYIYDLTDVLKYMLNKINDMSEDNKPSENPYFILVRNVPGINIGKYADDAADSKLVAESWHKDYLWAPAEFSSIIYYKYFQLTEQVPKIDVPEELINIIKSSNSELTRKKIIEQIINNKSNKLDIIKARSANWIPIDNIKGADFCLTPNFVDEIGLNLFFSQEEIGNYFRDLYFEIIKKNTIKKLEKNLDAQSTILVEELKNNSLYSLSSETKNSIKNKLPLYEAEDIYLSLSEFSQNIIKLLDNSNIRNVLRRNYKNKNTINNLIKKSHMISSNPTFPKGTTVQISKNGKKKQEEIKSMSYSAENNTYIRNKK